MIDRWSMADAVAAFVAAALTGWVLWRVMRPLLPEAPADPRLGTLGDENGDPHE